ncbi:TOBE domain-containing protein, partial [Chromohalobacter japonicus]
EIHQRFQVTMVYVTHDQLEASTFADKIAVMYEGQVVQFGTPRELFETPNHTFVGYFIGSPGMNFLNVSASDGVVWAGDTTLTVGHGVCDAIEKAASSNIKLGIRPEFIEVHTGPVEGGMSAQVDHAQDLGTYSIIYLTLGGASLKARIEEDQVTPAGKAWLRFPDERLGLYVDEYRVEIDHE